MNATENTARRTRAELKLAARAYRKARSRCAADPASAKRARTLAARRAELQDALGTARGD